MIVRLLGVVTRQVEERALLAALWDEYVNACHTPAVTCNLFREQLLQHFAIFKIDRNIYVPRHIGLSDVKLLEQGRDEFTRVERIKQGTGIIAGRLLTL